MAVRLDSSQREAVRRDLAAGRFGWWSGELAWRFSDQRRGGNPALKAAQYQEAILNYRDWLIANYRKVRAQARAA